MGLFSKSSKLKFKAIPSAPEQTQARSYLTGLMDNDIRFPTERIAPLTGTEQQIQGQLPSYLSQIDADFGAARGYYNDVLSGGYDPSTSDFYQGFRNEQESMKQDAQLNVRRAAQVGGMARSTPSVGIQARTGQAYDDQTLRQLGLLYENERGRQGHAAGSLSQLGGQQLGQLSQVEQLAYVQRAQEQAKLSAMYQAALQTMLAPYEMNAKIAQALLNEPRYTGYQTGGGATDLGMGLSMGTSLLGSYMTAGAISSLGPASIGGGNAAQMMTSGGPAGMGF